MATGCNFLATAVEGKIDSGWWDWRGSVNRSRNRTCNSHSADKPACSGYPAILRRIVDSTG